MMAIDAPSAQFGTRSSALKHALISLVWFGLFAQWWTVVPTIVPNQVSSMLKSDAATVEAVSGSIVAAGAFLALVVNPIAGAISDHWRGVRGRRRQFLIFGTLGSSIALGLLVPFGPGSNIILYLIAFLHLQFWWNWVAGPYAGLIPDVVAESDWSASSAWIVIMATVGAIAGLLVMVVFYSPERPAGAIYALIVLNLACLALMLRNVREPPALRNHSLFSLTDFVRSFWLDPRVYGNFYWVSMTRLMVNMGLWSVLTFLGFYLSSVVGVEDPANRVSEVLLVVQVCGIPACLLAGSLANRYRLVTIVKVTSWMMAGAVLCYVPIVLHPNFPAVAAIIILFGIGYGAYQALDWNLALKVLPNADTAGKDMGLWHVCMVVPQIIGPAGNGWLISIIKMQGSTGDAYVTAFTISALWFVAASLLISRVRI
jgi:Na+/melibiose symporter-like transporter